VVTLQTWQALQSLYNNREVTITHLHHEEYPDVGLICEATDNSQAADTKVKELNAEIRQQEARTNLIGKHTGTTH